MAYKTNELKKQALKAIRKHKLFWIQEVAAFLPCSKHTFYYHFPNETNDRKEIDDALRNNRF